MPRFEEFQFIITPVLLQVDEDGAVPRAVQGEPRVLHGVVELRRFCDAFPDNLEQLNAASDQGKRD